MGTLNRLKAACQWVAILSSTEADGLLRDWRMFRECEHRKEIGCEAVMHFGGPHKVLAAAFRHRHAARTAWGGRRTMCA